MYHRKKVKTEFFKMPELMPTCIRLSLKMGFLQGCPIYKTDFSVPCGTLTQLQTWFLLLWSGFALGNP